MNSKKKNMITIFLHPINMLLSEFLSYFYFSHSKKYRHTSDIFWVQFQTTIINKVTGIFWFLMFMKVMLTVSVQFSSVAQSCPTLCDPTNHSTPGLSVNHNLPEFTQPHVHKVGDANQPSHPLSSPSPPAPNPSQHQGLFQ